MHIKSPDLSFMFSITREIDVSIILNSFVIYFVSEDDLNPDDFIVISDLISNLISSPG